MYCCVPFCKSHSRNRKGPNFKISFHEFPLDENLCKQWLRRVARKDFSPYLTKQVVCSKHFTSEDYVQNTKHRMLKKGTVPTVFPMYPSYALLPPPESIRSPSSFNHDHVKKLPMMKYERTNPLKKVRVKNSTTNKSTNHHNEDQVFIKEDEINRDDSTPLLQTLNHLKRLSTANSKKTVAGNIASSTEMTSSTNNNSPQKPVNHTKRSFISDTKISTLKDDSCIAINSDIISTNILSEQSFTSNGSHQDNLVANNCPSLDNLNHPEMSTVCVSAAEYVTVQDATEYVTVQDATEYVTVQDATEYVTVKDATDMAFNSGTPFSGDNLPKQSSVVGVHTINAAKEDYPDTNNMLIGEQESVVDQNRELRHKLKKMKEEMDKLAEKLSVYESNDHKILKKIGALKKNSVQSNFIMDQVDNYVKKRPTWRESTIRECATWVAVSPDGYDFVRERKLMVLPSRKTLLRYAYSGEPKIDFCNLGSSKEELPDESAVENSVSEN